MDLSTDHISTPEKIIETGTSLCWRGRGAHGSSDLVFFKRDRVASFRDKSLDEDLQSSANSETDQNAVSRDTWPDKLAGFLQASVPFCTPCDDNEIELEDDETNEGTEHSPIDTDLSCSLELFSLGTGCAAPSAYRGASAYLLRRRNESEVLWCMLLEVGEGFITQYLRHVSSDIQSLQNISLIWVSHAHWDHFGGLVPLLSVLFRGREKSKTTRTPIVLAPRVVLQFCENMLCQKSTGEWFIGVAHEDRMALGKALEEWNTRNCGNIAFWENIVVDHSCRSSYGCIFGVRLSTQQPFSFAYSGDTRPSRRFVEVCRRMNANDGVDFLLHEATFDDEEKEMAKKKKHSTVQEALDVGRDISAKKVLLSHFSQRYDCLPKIPVYAEKQIGFALDGLRVILT